MPTTHYSFPGSNANLSELLSAFALDQRLGGSLEDFLFSFVVPLEVPFKKYFKGVQNYNPAGRFDKCWARISDWHSEP